MSAVLVAVSWKVDTNFLPANDRSSKKEESCKKPSKTQDKESRFI